MVYNKPYFIFNEGIKLKSIMQVNFSIVTNAKQGILEELYIVFGNSITYANAKKYLAY